MSVLDSFVSYDFRAGIAQASFTENGVLFNTGTVLKLGCPEFVQLFINPETKEIAIQACNTEIENCTSFCSKTRKERNSNLCVRIAKKELINVIAVLMDWDFSKKAYRAEGKYYSQENVVVFDLAHAKEM